MFERYLTVFGTGTPLLSTALQMKPLMSTNLFDTEEGDVVVKMVLVIRSGIARSSFA